METDMLVKRVLEGAEALKAEMKQQYLVAFGKGFQCAMSIMEKNAHDMCNDLKNLEELAENFYEAQTTNQEV